MAGDRPSDAPYILPGWPPRTVPGGFTTGRWPESIGRWSADYRLARARSSKSRARLTSALYLRVLQSRSTGSKLPRRQRDNVRLRDGPVADEVVTWFQDKVPFPPSDPKTA